MNIALIGYGKMGKTIERIATERGHHITLKIDTSNLSEFTRENLLETKTDVAIEFTHPEAAFENIYKLLSTGVSVVSGTTGWLDRWSEIEDYVQEVDGTLLYASNFSIGVNIFFEINRKLAELMSNYPEYDVDIEEIHHLTKKDAPSGTAISLAEGIIKHHEAIHGWEKEQADKGNIPVKSQRLEDVKGTHHVRYNSDIDEIEITHKAKTRDGFALGSIIAAEFLQGKTGIYSMKDVLDI